jgi:ParB family chromosome partitioning protein
MAGRRVNLSDLASEAPVPEARVPTFAESAARSVRIDHIATNPLNTRDVHAWPEKITELATSLREHGQIQPCAVVSRTAFLGIYPEYERAIGDATYVQVTGARRRAAALEAGLDSLEVSIKNGLADNRASFLSATAAENIERQDYDPIEEALAVKALAGECGSQKDAAAKLSRTAAWVTQRLNLLKLTPELQRLIRRGDMPIRVGRELAQLPAGDQERAWSEYQEAQLTAVNSAESGETEVPAQRAVATTTTRRSAAAVAIRRLGGTPPKIAEALRSELPREQLQELADLLVIEPDPET